MFLHTTSLPRLAQVAEPEMVERRDKWQALAAQFDVELPAVAFAFAFAPSVVAKLVVGPATPEQLEANLRCASIECACLSKNWHRQLTRLNNILQHTAVGGENKQQTFRTNCGGLQSRKLGDCWTLTRLALVTESTTMPNARCCLM